MKSTNSILEFIIYTEGLKRELRNSWLSDGRRESVAEHSWRMALLAMTLAPRTQLDLDMEKVLKMIAIHDLGEIETGDIPTIYQTETTVAQKNMDEDQAFVKMSLMLDKVGGDDLYELWREFEEQKTVEAQFVKIIDKFECVIQKNQQSVDKNPGAPDYFTKLAKLCAADPELKSFYNRIILDVKTEATPQKIG